MRLFAAGRVFALLCLAILVTECTPSNTAVQAKVLDGVTQAANDLAPALVEGYKAALFKCLTDAKERIDYATCRADADHEWTVVRMRWGQFRNVQADYAKALETHAPDAETYFQWLKVSYCDLRKVIPDTMKLPAIPGLECAP